MAILKT